MAHNIVLQCVSLGMGVVTTRGFDEDALKNLLKLSEWEHPIHVLPVGKKQASRQVSTRSDLFLEGCFTLFICHNRL